MRSDHRVHALADDVYDTLMAAAPVEATQIGDRRFDAELADLRPDGRAALASALERLRDELDALDVSTLSPADRVTRDVAEHVLTQARHEQRSQYIQFAAGSMTSGATIGSPASALLVSLPKLVLDTAEQTMAYLDRCRAIPDHLRAAEDQLRAGLAARRDPPRRLVASTRRQITRYLDTAITDDPLLLASDAWHTADLDALRAVLADEVRPAFDRHAAMLANEIDPNARSDKHVGLCWLPDGEAIYREAAAVHTTTSASPERLHQLGHNLIADLADEYRALGSTALGTSDLAAIFERLRTDPALRFSQSHEILETAEVALARARAHVGSWIATSSTTPCEVREVPAAEAPESTVAYYHPPTLDGRPGAYYVNTSEASTRTRFEAEALAFHESVPGHHTQIARAMELDLPTLQRISYVTAFAEGWALYAERLADEMGLYTDDLAKLGMLAFDSWRACRLVVDTGMHALGWSRDRAVAFMRDNSPLANNNTDNEVDRYIGWPGQALAYMAGRARIVHLRRRAELELGAAFDLATFHDVVLGQAAVPLWTLERSIDAWIARCQRQP